MTDPERLLKSPSNSIATLLLRAAAEERPSAAVLSRTTEAVAAAAAAKTTTGSAAAAWGAKHAALGAVAKWMAIGALGGAAALSSVQALIAEPETKHAPAVLAPGANARATIPSRQASAARQLAPEPVVAVDPEPARPNTTEPQRARSSEPSPRDLAKSEAPARAESALLAAEVRFVDQGRAALQRAAFAEAIEQLAPYEGLFPHQQLLTEVLFLRMESFSRLGNVERARGLAARVLALGVVGRQAAQAREVLGH